MKPFENNPGFPSSPNPKTGVTSQRPRPPISPFPSEEPPLPGKIHPEISVTSPNDPVTIAKTSNKPETAIDPTKEVQILFGDNAAGLEPATETISVIHLLLKYLEAEGVEYIFGIPGGPLMPLYEALSERGRIRPILAKHEEGAAFMADGYARVTGRMGVCCTTTGPGATNALTGIACAHRDSVPVLIITAQVSTASFGRGAVQESSPLGVDVVSLYKNVTKASLQLVNPETMGHTLRTLLRTCRSGRPGPVHLSLPADMIKQPITVDFRPPVQYRSQSESMVDEHSLEEASKLILRAQSPVLLAGYGVHLAQAHDELRALSQQLAIPVATTPRAKGVFPEDHLLSLGAFGLGSSPQAENLLLSEECDLVVAVGTSFSESSTQGWDRRLSSGKSLLQIDLDPNEIGKNYPVKVGLVGDARQILQRLLEQIKNDFRWQETLPDFEKRLTDFRQWKTHYPRVQNADQMEDNSLPLKPPRIMAEIQRALPDDALIFVDIGNVMAWAIHYLRVREPGSFFLNLGFGSMGHAVAAALGGQLAAPHRPVVALVGDAAFAMNGMEVHTAVENDLPVIWVVMNNGGHGMVHVGETLQFGGKFNASLFRHPLKIAKMAEAMGAVAFRVEGPGQVEWAIKRALELKRPTVIDVGTDPDAIPPMGSRIEMLNRIFQQDKN